MPNARTQLVCIAVCSTVMCQHVVALITISETEMIVGQMMGFRFQQRALHNFRNLLVFLSPLKLSSSDLENDRYLSQVPLEGGLIQPHYRPSLRTCYTNIFWLWFRCAGHAKKSILCYQQAFCQAGAKHSLGWLAFNRPNVHGAGFRAL